MSEADIDEDLIASAKAVVVTGTHFSTATLDAASRKAMRLAKAHGGKVVLDIDYRPVLWGLTGHGLGEERFVANDAVSAHLQTILPECDLIVGTEEEIHIAGGSTDTMAAIRAVRAAAPEALIVVKRGPMGCTAFPGPIPATIDEGVSGPGFPVEVFNVLGAGDAFMSGFLRGWLRDLPLAECCRLANACGAFAVSRHGCAPAIPSWNELEGFLRDRQRAPAAARGQRSSSRCTGPPTAARHWPQVLAFAFDHRAQFEEMCARLGTSAEHIPYFKRLALSAAMMTADGRSDGGILLDGRFGQDALDQATGKGLWIGRPVELPGSRPVALRGRAGSRLHVARAGPPSTASSASSSTIPTIRRSCAAEQERAGADPGRRLPPHRPRPAARGDPGQVASTGRRHAPWRAPWPASMRLGVYPDWWKLPHPGSDPAWVRDRRRDRRQRPALPRRPAARAGSAGGRAAGGVRHGAPAPGLQGLRRRPDHLRASRPRTGSPAGSTTSRRSRPWRRAIAA